MIPGLNLALTRIAAPLPIWHGEVSADEWRAAAHAVAAAKGRVVALWGAPRQGRERPQADDIRRPPQGPRRGPFVALGDEETSGGRAFPHEGSAASVCVAYQVPQGLAWLDLALDAETPTYPDLATIFPAAGRMQRACADLLGPVAEGAADQRPWLDHGLWPPNYRPLRDAAPVAQGNAGPPAEYPFVRVEGDGVHEIAVGPVHAGIIEPGHFRFSVVGEKVLRLEQQLGYVHKGISQRFTQLGALEAQRLAARVSGDSTVAFGWAYCMALEAAAACTVPERALHLRALLLERERIANHLGDLGALGNDAALSFGLAQFARLREDWQRLSLDAFGHRLLMDTIVPGGVAADPTPALIVRLIEQCETVESELKTLRAIYDEHAGLQDRFIGTGRIAPQLAARLGLTGLAGRASGQSADLRCDHPWPPYEALAVRRSLQHNGDVAARVNLRFDEAFESLRLIRLLCAGLPGGPVRGAIAAPAGSGFGAGWVEGWRGEVFVALELGPGGTIRHCHCQDPSMHNWPALEHAVIGNIVPDFPLINKSFNLSYSGHDL